jgi:hypothetical protein
MNRLKVFIFMGLVLLLGAGCAGNRRLQRIEELKNQPDWPRIRMIAEAEVIRRQRYTDSSSTHYEPEQHTNGVWAVVISAPYPGNRSGDSTDMLIRDGGEVISIKPRMIWRKETAERRQKLLATYPPGETTRADVQKRWPYQPDLSKVKPAGGWENAGAEIRARVNASELRTGLPVYRCDRYFWGGLSGSMSYYWFYYDEKDGLVDAEWQWHTD